MTDVMDVGEEGDGPPGGPGAVLSYLREGAPAEVTEAQLALANAPHSLELDAQGITTRARAFVNWLDTRGFRVVVFDMDKTMSRGHCGQGLRREDVGVYLNGKSNDFVEAATAIAVFGRHKLAVATGSDPLEYDLPGQNRETHILGPDLAAALIDMFCPTARPSFEIMVGFDCELHGGEARDKGKRHHMRLIREHYGVEFGQMVLFDDSAGCLDNEDGWVGIRVRDNGGFRFEDCFHEGAA